jgi:tetratricopeptide (TPR) repeat protein
MKPSDSLHALIHSLTKTEKRYFRLWSSLQKGDKVYLKLFEVIDAQAVYDEAHIKEKFRKEAFVRQLTFTKNYLYNQVLKSLQLFRSGSSTRILLGEIAGNAEVLFEKGLYDQCLKLIRTGKQLGHLHEIFPPLLDLLRLERRLLYIGHISKDSAQQLKAVADEEKKVIQLVSTENRVRDFLNDLWLITHNKSVIRSAAEMRELKAVKDGVEALTRKKELASFRSRSIASGIQLTYYDAAGDYDNAYKHTIRKIELFEQYPAFKETEQNSYLAGLSDAVQYAVMRGKYSEALDILERMVKIRTHGKQGRLIIFYAWAMYRLQICIYTGQFEQGMSIAKGIEKVIREEFNGVITQTFEYDLYYLLAYTYFGGGELNRSLRWLGKILNRKRDEISADEYGIGILLALIVHFELNNLDQLLYYTRSFYKFLYKKDRLYKFEKVLFRFLQNKLAHHQTREKVIATFPELHAMLVKLMKNRFERQALRHFDLIAWLEAKISGRDFSEVILVNNKRSKEKVLVK